MLRPSDDGSKELLDVQIVGLNGEGFVVRVPDSVTGHHLQKIASDCLGTKAGARVVLQKGTEIRGNKSLKIKLWLGNRLA